MPGLQEDVGVLSARAKGASGGLTCLAERADRAGEAGTPLQQSAASARAGRWADRAGKGLFTATADASADVVVTGCTGPAGPTGGGRPNV